MKEQFLKLIFNDAQRLEDLVTELMELTRLESGDIELNLIKISPFHIIKSSFDRFFQICLNKKIELHLDPKSENVNSLVNVDTDKFDQVLANMINNAIKWTDENGEIVESGNITSSLSERILGRCPVEDIIDTEGNVILEKGNIIEKGTHDELLKNSKVYENLYKKQVY